jgi:hypothetical protein
MRAVFSLPLEATGRQLNFFSKGSLAGKLACGSEWKTESLAQNEVTLGAEDTVWGRHSVRVAEGKNLPADVLPTRTKWDETP